MTNTPLDRIDIRILDALQEDGRLSNVDLAAKVALAEGIAALTDKPVLRGDNGATLKATTVLAMLNWLGVKPSYSRLRVSEDNAYAEGVAVPHGQVPPGVPGEGLRRSQRGTRLGDRLRALVQRRPSTQ